MWGRVSSRIVLKQAGLRRCTGAAFLDSSSAAPPPSERLTIAASRWKMCSTSSPTPSRLCDREVLSWNDLWRLLADDEALLNSIVGDRVEPAQVAPRP
jgi:hypothetical protein